MFHDVRMRGFRRRTDVEEVQAWLDGLPLAARSEPVPLAAAAGRTLAAPLVSTVDVPGFARAAMDGWALSGEVTFGASETDPVSLEVVGTSLPGRPHAGRVGRGQAVRIMTGAPVPEGCDTVLRAEEGTQEGARLAVRAALAVGRHVGQAGEDITAGRRVLEAGRRLRPQDVGVASSIGVAELVVHARPRVVLLLTGDELLPPGTLPEGARIADANSPTLQALIERDGGSVTHTHHLPDDATRLADALAQAAGDADLVIVTGGSSVGQEDHAPRLLAELGELRFHGVALRPAAPTGVGRLGCVPVCLLPGNPVSCLCGYDFFAGRVVRRAAGRSPEWPYRSVRAPLARKISSVLGRADYVRVRVAQGGVEPLMARGASILSSTTEADGFVVVPRDLEGHPEGADVEVWLYD